MEPLLTDPARPWKKAAFTGLVQKQNEKIRGRSIRTDRWRYTEWTEEKDGTVTVAGRELYDHQMDPGEFTNLLHPGRDQAEKFAAIGMELSEQLKRGWRAALPESVPAPHLSSGSR